MSRLFHTAELYSALPAVDRIAWALAVATMHTLVNEEDHSAKYRECHRSLWNIEAHRRAVKLRDALVDLGKHT